MDNTQKQVKFAELFSKGDRVLELGCGRGDFLRLCKARGIAATGVDMNGKKARGLKIIKKDALKFVKKEKGSKYSGIYARHIVEHINEKGLAVLFRNAKRILKKGLRKLKKA